MSDKRRRIAYFTGGISGFLWILEIAEQVHGLDTRNMRFVPVGNTLYRTALISYFVIILGMIAYASSTGQGAFSEPMIPVLILLAVALIAYPYLLILLVVKFLRQQGIEPPSSASLYFSLFGSMHGLRYLQERVDNVAT